jgi:hypothetical protein
LSPVHPAFKGELRAIARESFSEVKKNAGKKEGAPKDAFTIHR